jgi:hypothetical protein
MAASQGIDLYHVTAASGANLHTAIKFLGNAMAKSGIIIPYAKRNLNPWRKGNSIIDPNDYTK